jgi:hypothetical protein
VRINGGASHSNSEARRKFEELKTELINEKVPGAKDLQFDPRWAIQRKDEMKFATSYEEFVTYMELGYSSVGGSVSRNGLPTLYKNAFSTEIIQIKVGPGSRDWLNTMYDIEQSARFVALHELGHYQYRMDEKLFFDQVRANRWAYTWMR